VDGRRREEHERTLVIAYLLEPIRLWCCGIPPPRGGGSDGAFLCWRSSSIRTRPDRSSTFAASGLGRFATFELRRCHLARPCAYPSLCREMQPTCIKKDRVRGSNRQQGAADGRGCGGAHDEELNVVPARARAPPLVADSRMGRRGCRQMGRRERAA
jgi:hypothetical protein